jgi:hypothetical protein
MSRALLRVGSMLLFGGIADTVIVLRDHPSLLLLENLE